MLVFDSALALAVILVCLGGAAICDVRHRIVPNWLTFGLAFAGLLAHWHAVGPQAAMLSLAGMSIGLALFSLPFYWRFVGGGDLKLVGASGAWLGPVALCESLLWIGVFGAGLSLIYWLSQGRRASTPYAVAIAMGICVVLSNYTGMVIGA